MAFFEKNKTFSDIFTNKKIGSIREIKINNPNRPLTSGEVKLVQSVYKNKIDCRKVKIYLGSYFSFVSQDINTLVTPNGNIYVMQELYREDYSFEDNSFKRIFIHEMGHVWQYQKKLNVLVRAGAIQACSIFSVTHVNSYDIFERKYYKWIFEPKKLIDYNLEQQAEIFCDYWALQNEGFSLLEKSNKERIRVHNLKDIVAIYTSKVDEALL